VQRRDAVAELAQDVPEAGRVGASGHEAGNLAAGLDQLVAADVLGDAPADVHTSIVARQKIKLRYEIVLRMPIDS